MRTIGIVSLAGAAHLALLAIVGSWILTVPESRDPITVVDAETTANLCDLCDEPPVEEIPPLVCEEEPLRDPTISNTAIGIGGGAGGSFGARSARCYLRAEGGGGSTGGNAEPNGRPYGDVFFRHAGVNPFVDTEDDRLSTFALDVDTASYTIARRYLLDGNLPDRDSVRVEEFVNRFASDDPDPRVGVFGLRAELMRSPFGKPRHHLLRVGLRARSVTVVARKPANLTFVVDTSGSMASGNRLGLVKDMLGMILDRLGPDDRIALVSFGSAARIEQTITANLDGMRNGISKLSSGGSTNAEHGLDLGYGEASRAFRKGMINRVILCSDGVANVGARGPAEI
ncbi:MAG: VWA domain-containing protein, partial [Phycisphaeraceae bacterium]|nr:VWA domain-containing protein [Phycisphaeraceae bacterium]